MTLIHPSALVLANDSNRDSNDGFHHQVRTDCVSRLRWAVATV
jgi:hypothetical protein